ncbi:hypothetical protein Ocin01_12906 [Orchesella cincta]|uniref:BTB domain-containing protein n=1 Tax=Orchesella cincta TaxID=48709 RepID=A0A1D2ML68_ORCCI|nr:hypothetical protein Ocin01_12906 [Orchesella cincta]
MSHSKRFPAPSRRVLIRPGCGGHQAAMMATGRTRTAYSSAMSDCWNNGSSSSRTSTSNSTRLAQAYIKTSCLFCSKVVMLAGLHPEPARVITRRQKNLQNLCFHFKLNGKELPTNATKIQFPFCTTCEKYVKELTVLQETLEKVKLEIDKTVNSIERIVADTEVLGNRGQPSPIERQKFIKLYDMILEGYRNKLMIRHQINNSMTPESAPIETGDLSPNPMENREHRATGIEMEEEYDETIEIFMDSHEVRVDHDEELSNTTDVNHQDYYQGESYANVWNMEDPREVSRSNENDCTLVITSVQSVAAVGTGTPDGDNRDGVSSIANVEVIDLVELDNEAMASPDEEEDEDADNASLANVTADAEQPQSFLFEDVQSVQKSQPVGPHRKEATLSCDICEKAVRGALIHLLRHKFTHKNDEERRESLRKKERGCYNAFLSKKLTIAYKRKQNIGAGNGSSSPLTAKRMNLYLLENHSTSIRFRRGSTSNVIGVANFFLVTMKCRRLGRFQTLCLLQYNKIIREGRNCNPSYLVTQVGGDIDEIFKYVFSTSVSSSRFSLKLNGSLRPYFEKMTAVHGRNGGFKFLASCKINKSAANGFEIAFGNQSTPIQHRLNLSEEGLKALLDFVYCLKLDIPREKPSVALELLDIGIKKQMPMLTKAINSLLVEQPDDWFGFDAALQLFLHSTKMQGYDELKKKAVRKGDEMESSELCDQLLRTDPKSSKMLMKALSGP